ncbi:MAG: MurR/RpiR family transcriptional regulator [Geminicoccaceae bacterium]
MNDSRTRTRDTSQETYESLRLRIRERFPRLSPHLQRVARASQQAPNAFALNTIATIAGEVGVQPSTLIRFAKELGYSGFSDLQKVFRLRLIEGAANVREQVYTKGEARGHPVALRDTLERCIAAHVEALEALRRDLSEDRLAEAVRLLRTTRHTYVAGLRRSRPMATYLAYGLKRSERPCSLLDFGGGMAAQEVAGMAANDLLVAIAFPPYSPPVVEVVMDAFLGGRRILAITDGEASPLARHATAAIFVDAGADARFQPISGTICLIQTLVTALSEA